MIGVIFLLHTTFLGWQTPSIFATKTILPCSRVRIPQPIKSLFKPIGSPETLSQNSRAPLESITLTRRNTTGIAHDPIQRDIFTPLFLGARLLVPAKEDIRHERLAEWMRKYEATVTHLTPAMGQILVGGASAEFPSLRNAFFVGDQLIKRDCRLLQALAPNCRIINMFGIPIFS